MSLTNKALFVIERNLNGDLSLGEIARRCDVSRFHLAHAFGEATGQSVMEYVRGRRLTEAAYALASGTAPDILSVALDSGYASHEAFSRAFKERFAKTPEEIKKSESVAGLKPVDPIRHLESKRMTLKEPRIQKAGELKFVGLKEHVAFDAMESIAGQWQRFMSGPYHEIADKADTPPVGVNMGLDDSGIDYACAAEVTRTTEPPKGLIALTVAPTTYAVFSHDGHVTEIRQTYDAIWNDWFPKSGRTPAQAPGLERHNPTFDPRTGNGGITIWIALQD